MHYCDLQNVNKQTRKEKITWSFFNFDETCKNCFINEILKYMFKDKAVNYIILLKHFSHCERILKGKYITFNQVKIFHCF